MNRFFMVCMAMVMFLFPSVVMADEVQEAFDEAVQQELNIKSINSGQELYDRILEKLTQLSYFPNIVGQVAGIVIPVETLYEQLDREILMDFEAILKNQKKVSMNIEYLLVNTEEKETWKEIYLFALIL